MTNEGEEEEEKDGGEGADAGRWMGERGEDSDGRRRVWGEGGAEYEIDLEEGGSYKAH